MRGAAADLLLGSRCAGCLRPGRVLCPECSHRLVARPWCCWPDPRPAVLVAAGVAPYAGGDYTGLLRRLVLAYKDEHRSGLAQPLGRLLSVVVEHVLTRVQAPSASGGISAGISTGISAGPTVELVPVPSSRANARRRGRDPVADLARSAARQLRRRGHDVRVLGRLRHHRVVVDQAGLGARERAANLRWALTAGSAAPAARAGAKPSVRLVVDDVITTGATGAEAVRALEAAGWAVTAVAVVAATRRRLPGVRRSDRADGLSRTEWYY